MDDDGKDPHIHNSCIIRRQGEFSYTLQPATIMELLKCPHLTQSCINHLTTEPQYITQQTLFCLIYRTVCKMLLFYSNWCVWGIIFTLVKPNCYTEIISKLLSLLSRPSSGLHVRRAFGMVQLNMSSIHWHVLSHVESWNFRPFELTRFSRQFVPERASCSLSGRTKYSAFRGIHISVHKGA